MLNERVFTTCLSKSFTNPYYSLVLRHVKHIQLSAVEDRRRRVKTFISLLYPSSALYSLCFHHKGGRGKWEESNEVGYLESITFSGSHNRPSETVT